MASSAASSSACACWRTRFITTFAPSVRLPIMGAPMAGVSGGMLASETCKAGGLGFIAAGHLINSKSLEQLEKEINIFRSNNNNNDIGKTTLPLCIGFIGHSTFGSVEGFQLFEQVLIKHKPSVVQFFAPSISHHPTKANNTDSDSDTALTNIQIAHNHDAKVLCQVGNVSEAIQAMEAGADGIIAQGSEAGGHGLRRELGNGTLPLAARIVKLAAASASSSPTNNNNNNNNNKPIVLAAGGISDGRGVAAALALGCDGAVLGTRLWASKEALSNDSRLKDQLVSSKVNNNKIGGSGGGHGGVDCDDVTRTRAFDQVINTYSETPWPFPYDSVGALRNDYTNQWDDKPNELDRELLQQKQKKQKQNENVNDDLASKYRAATKNGDAKMAQVLSGEGVGEIDSIESTKDILERIDHETRIAIQSMSNLLC